MIAVQFNLQTCLNYTLVFLALAGGLVAGMLGGRMMHLYFGVEGIYVADGVTTPLDIRQPQEADLQVILERSLFNAAAIGSKLELVALSDEVLESEPVVATTNIDNLSLVGTVVAGDYSLALIQSAGKVEIFGLGSELAPGVTITAIERRMIVLMNRGVRRELLLVEQQAGTPAGGAAGRPAPAAARTAPASGVVSLGEGRWRVDRAMVDSARANMGALLQSARMIPQIESGQTTGFRLVGMQRGSLLEQLGLRLGDIVVEINRVKLDSPEKALQVFQQVREANNISLGLIRDGQPQIFEYSFE